MSDTKKEIREAVKALQEIRTRLNQQFEHWEFTLDGNLVGDIGEAYVFAHFDVTKIGTGTKDHDFEASDGKLVQVKMTQRTTLGLGLKEPAFEYLVALYLDSDGEIEVLYNGPGATVYTRPGKPHRKSIPIKELRKLNMDVNDANRVPKRTESSVLPG